MIAIIATFLPAFLLSGFLFDIDSMPPVVQAITHIVAARYFVAILQTLFLAGDVWSVILPNAAALLLMAPGVPRPDPAPDPQAPGVARWFGNASSRWPSRSFSRCSRTSAAGW